MPTIRCHQPSLLCMSQGHGRYWDQLRGGTAVRSKAWIKADDDVAGASRRARSPGTASAMLSGDTTPGVCAGTAGASSSRI